MTESQSYLQKVFVVKTGGKILENMELRDSFLDAFSELNGSGLLVHGGGKTATEIAAKLGVEAPVINGRRITNPQMLEVALMVYGGLMNRQLVAQLQARGLTALGVTGADLNLIQAVKRPVKEIDYGLAGDIVGVNTSVLSGLLQQSIVPVMAPLTHDQRGQMLNTNADTIAATVAGALAEREESVSLVFCFEKKGVLRDPDIEDSLIEELDELDFAAYKDQGMIADGMIPKLHNAFRALRQGVERVFICHPSNLNTVGSPDFVGTQVVLHSGHSIAG